MRSPVALLCFAAVLAWTPSRAQEAKVAKNDIPKGILSSFTRAYPKGVILGASKETENGKLLYEIESADGSLRRDLLYTPEGKLIEIEETVEPDSLPHAVAKEMKRQLGEGKLVQSERVIRGRTVRYEFHIDHGGHVTEIVLDPNGRLLKPASEDEDEDEDDDD
jgi:hypothetical protein